MLEYPPQGTYVSIPSGKAATSGVLSDSRVIAFITQNAQGLKVQVICIVKLFYFKCSSCHLITIVGLVFLWSSIIISLMGFPLSLVLGPLCLSGRNAPLLYLTVNDSTSDTSPIINVNKEL